MEKKNNYQNLPYTLFPVFFCVCVCVHEGERERWLYSVMLILFIYCRRTVPWKPTSPVLATTTMVQVSIDSGGQLQKWRYFSSGTFAAALAQLFKEKADVSPSESFLHPFSFHLNMQPYQLLLAWALVSCPPQACLPCVFVFWYVQQCLSVWLVLIESDPVRM